MSSRAAVAIYGTALATDEGSFTMEDVLFTGVLREKAGIATPTVDGDLCHHYMGNYGELKQIIRNKYSKI